MGHQQNRSYVRPVQHPPQSLDATRPTPPPLPPRTRSTLAPTPSVQATPSVVLPPRSEFLPSDHSSNLTLSWSAQDPRSCSTQSLVPHSSSSNSDKRTLLLIYIHGFLGNETSFQSFPAHVHNIVTERLKASHVVHTKIYPRYKTREKIGEGVKKFSDWLGPHESPATDVILLGHSLGGILSAEVVLLPLDPAGSSGRSRHQILGTINFDTPFLGMHPGVVASGLGSLSRPAPESPGPGYPAKRMPSPNVQPSSATEGEHSAASSSYFNPLAGGSTTSLPTDSSSSTALPAVSPLSFDLPTNDPNYNPTFYNDIKLAQRKGWKSALHFINKHSDGLVQATKSYVTSHLEFGGCLADYRGLKKRYANIRDLEDGREGVRVRFVNYYTASTGRPKKAKKPEEQVTERAGGQEADLGQDASQKSLGDSDGRACSASPRISIEAAEGEGTRGKGEQVLDSQSGFGDRDESTFSESAHGTEQVDSPSIRDDQGEKAAGSITGGSSGLRTPFCSETLSTTSLPSLQQADSLSPKHPAAEEATAPAHVRDIQGKKSPRDKKFCLLPSRVSGQIDSCWIRVFMPGVDEVGAHCGLFFMDGERYEWFVGDVGGKIVDWVRENRGGS